MKTSATIITGFLGAGKTTLIKHLLRNSDGIRIALIINEFGSLGIDQELIVGCGDKNCNFESVVELTNGCICCTVSDDFLPTIEALLDSPKPPDHIIIEASGLALPKSLVRAFNWPEVRSRVSVNGVVAVVDGPAVKSGLFLNDIQEVRSKLEADFTLDHDNPLQEVFEDQLLCADIVVLNKSDLLDESSINSVRADLIGTVNPGVKVVSTIQGDIDPRVLLGIGTRTNDFIEDELPHHDHDEFESFVVDLTSVDDPQLLEDRIARTSEVYNILRIKGFVEVAGKDMRHVIQAVGSRVERYYDRPWNQLENRRSALVVIGESGIDRAAIESALRG
jgi:cobalamin biosynthesis protein CobW